ncbi:tyrosine-type recombinase/integrase, partial [Eisenbergiella tayi]
MARKGENIYKRKDGRWEGRYRMNNPADGRKRYCSVYGKTYKEVKEKLFIRKREHILDKGGCGCLPDGITMGEAVRMWLEERRYRWKESTFSTYRSIIEKHILPVIGK